MPPIRILLLEDSNLDADLTAARLRKSGLDFVFDRVQTRREFTHALSTNQYDIVLADYALPDFDGLAALEISHQLAPDTPFILVSGVLGEEFAIDAMHRGAADYVLKPRLERLAPAIERTLAAARTAREKQRSEERLRATQELHRRVLESSHDAIIVIGLDGKVRSMNTAGLKQMALTSDTAPGKDWATLWSTGEPAAAVAFAAALAGGVETFEAATVNEGGLRCFWEVVVSPVFDSENRPEQVVAVARDITERRRSESERQILLAREREARSEAESRNADLRRSLDDLEHFAFAASHDLREPLRVISLYSQLFSRKVTGQIDEQAREWLSLIENGARRLDVLLSDLLNYSRVVHVQEEYTRCEMTAVVDAAVANCRVALDENGGRVLHNGLPAVLGNRGQLVQVMQNLIENAVKYRSSEPPLIKVEAAQSREPDHWVFTVEDNGIGFSSEYTERIFGIFKRLHGQDYPGTGMGLAISRRIIERHGGRIWCKSEEGSGSTFFFTLPAAESAVAGTPVTQSNTAD